MENLDKIKNEVLETVKSEAQREAEKYANELMEKRLAEMDEKSKEKEQAMKTATDEEIAKAKESLQKEIADLSAELKATKQTNKKSQVVKSLHELIVDTVVENAEAIKSNSLKSDVTVELANKTVADMGISTHTSNFTPYIQEVNNNMILTPHNREWLADLLPQATASGNSIVFPKENGGEGGIAQWTSGNKAQVDYDLTTQTVTFKWIAGVAVVDVEMLDDIKFLSSYLSQKLYADLKMKENDFILNGDGTGTTYKGLIDVAQAYDGTYTTVGEQVVDAAYGQIAQDTHGWYTGNNVLINPRTAVEIGLNKATGSGEFDLPAGSIGFANGQLNIAGLNTTKTTDITAGDFLAFDSNAAMFIRRTAPKIEMFVDSALAKQNKVMFRIEERVGLAIFNEDAIVKSIATTTGA